MVLHIKYFDLWPEELLKTDFTGIVGPVVFDEKDNAEREFALKAVRNGEFVLYE